MNLIASLIAILILTLSALGITFSHLSLLLTAIIPYAAFAVFIGGFIYRIVKWAKAPVPFRITTTCGQQTSLPWINNSPLESPSNIWGVIGRMALEVFLFRSLFRNTAVAIVGLAIAEELHDWRRKVGGLRKVEQVRATGAKILVAPCANCKKQLRELVQFYKLNMGVAGLHDVLGKALVFDKDP